jgi:heme/copper-type cytochrome/quinol oxidase subunit 2
MLAAWLLFPLVNLDRVDMSNVKATLYRSALGITILIIFFGKTLFDLLDPWTSSRKLPRWNATLLILYMIALTGGIVFMVLRLAVVAAKSRGGGFPF